MRAIGTLDSEPDAQVFVDYLLVLGIDAEYDEDEGKYPIWVHADRDLEEAGRHLETFRTSPDRSTFARAAREAGSVRKNEAKEEKRAAKLQHTGRDLFRTYTVMGYQITLGPVTLALMVISVLLTLGTSFGTADYAEVLRFCYMGQLTTLNEWWRPIASNFIHLSMLHLLMNMFWLAYLGGIFEKRRPFWALLIVTLIGGAAGLLLEVWIDATFFDQVVAPAGMSGGVYALFGYLFVMMYRYPMSGFLINPGIAKWMLAWIPVGFLLTYFDYMPIANWGHVGGLLAGALYGYIEAAIRNRA